MKFNTKKIALTSVYLAVALVIGTIETLIPPFIPLLPQFRLGLSNFVVLLSLITIGYFPTLIIVVVKSCVVPLFFSNPIMIIYSLTASCTSYIVSLILIKIKKLGLPSISALSAIVHNLMQLAVAAILTQSAAIFWYMPLLTVCGGVSGAIIGLITALTIKKAPEKLFD